MTTPKSELLSWHKVRSTETLIWLIAIAAFFLFPNDLSFGASVLVMALFVISLDLALGFVDEIDVKGQKLQRGQRVQKEQKNTSVSSDTSASSKSSGNTSQSAKKPVKKESTTSSKSKSRTKRDSASPTSLSSKTPKS